MNQEDIALVGQLLISMKEAVEKLEEAHKSKNIEEFRAAKKEILRFQKKLEQIL